MNKFYVLVPLLGLLIFGGYYYKVDKSFKTLEAQKEQAAREEAKEKQIEANKQRQAAYDAALAASEQRKKEREERDRIEKEREQAKQDLLDKRELTFEDRKRLREQADRLKKDVAGVQEEITKIEAERKSNRDELAFLNDYVKTTKANMNSYYALLDKISNAEKAAAEAAKAAAAAAKK